MKRTVTTVADFDYWCGKVTFWLKRLGLWSEWEVRYQHRKGNDNTRAGITYGTDARIATIYLMTDWGDSAVSPAQLHRVALHEVLHLLLADLSILVGRRYNVSESEADRAEHAVLRRLEHSLYAMGEDARPRRATRARRRVRARRAR